MDLSDLIERNAAFTPDKAAIIFEGESLSYAAFGARIAQTARALKAEFGVSRGDRVAILSLNRPDYLVLLYACARLGAMLAADQSTPSQAAGRHEDEDQEDHRDDEHRKRQAPVPVVVDPRDDEHRDESDGDPGRLLDEVKARVVERIQRLDPARAVDHREADREETQNDRRQHEVVARPRR